MTARQFMQAADVTWPKVVVWAFLFGGMVATLKTTLSDKTSKAELSSVVDSMHAGDRLRDSAIGSIKLSVDSARGDIRTLIYIACGKASPDSFCRQGKP